jgi:hypothetical protein
MTSADLLHRLECAGVSLFVEDGALRYRSAPGAYTAELRRQVAARKPELLTLLAPPWNPAEADALVNRVLARRRQVFGSTDWPADPSTCRRLWPLVDAVNDAEWALDTAGLRQATARLLRVLGSGE